MLRRYGKAAFVLNIPRGGTVLDVGCGNASACYIKGLRPDIHYVGVDIGDYHQTDDSKSLMDEYIVSSPQRFSETIARQGDRFDAVISNHNLEHCNDQEGTLRAMASVLKDGGRMYLAFPSEATRGFPSRMGTLNFYDDDTHQAMPRWAQVMSILRGAGLSVDVAARRYRPPLFFIAGALMEPWSSRRRRIDRWGASWAFWGFESVIWARRT
ncbi:class I SAM-dependent methyltransferase [Sphingomonas sp. MMSM24]|uniref:Class I SAM-dependent methyltransferase n=2 Tax=Sphingomonas lycopersici TaxID=2951807 RepID=A0AA41ZK45_9SPHN|nr:class I SAM-dependent methyltransferase [Sphingomonas lycopersici]MCW6537283.1 class I SAM-dependent methyltransferase [Sphingomonas lycopersici]